MGRKDYYYDSNMPRINSIVAAASAVVTLPGERIVLHKRVDNDQWSLLGGAMEYGESIEQTIIREVKEESGLDCTVCRLIGVYTDPNHVIAYSDGEVRQEFSICFHCEARTGEITVSDESREVRAFTKEEIAALNLHPSQRIRIDDYFKKETAALIR
jgi:ADP-ribose pyrophosphatase YjhB (NUDIX family)